MAGSRTLRRPRVLRRSTVVGLFCGIGIWFQDRAARESGENVTEKRWDRVVREDFRARLSSAGKPRGDTRALKRSRLRTGILGRTARAAAPGRSGPRSR